MSSSVGASREPTGVSKQPPAHGDLEDIEILIQDPLGAARRTMPDAAIAAIVADAVLPLEDIGTFIYGLCVQPAAILEAADPR